MPFRSKDQLAKFAEMVKRGEISKETFHKWLDATPSVKALPDKVTKPQAFKVKKAKVIK